jgi:nitronate monooxygenase
LRAAGLDPDRLPDKQDRSYDSAGASAHRWRDMWAAGQGLGAVRAVEPLSAVVDRIETEYREALTEAAGRLDPPP